MTSAAEAAGAPERLALDAVIAPPSPTASCWLSVEAGQRTPMQSLSPNKSGRDTWMWRQQQGQGARPEGCYEALRRRGNRGDHSSEPAARQ